MLHFMQNKINELSKESYRMKLIFTFLTLMTLLAPSQLVPSYHIQPKVIMIDPAGHAKNPGRRLHKSYERAETYKFAEALKNELEKNHNVRVVLTRTPGDEIVPLQNASFANRLNVDFFLRINFFLQESAKPKLFVYHLVFDPIIDTVQRPFDPLAFVPVHQAHFKNIRNTMALANQFSSLLADSQYHKFFDVSKPYGIPLKPLVGIIAPALLIEMSLPSQDDQWADLVQPLAKSIALALDIKA